MPPMTTAASKATTSQMRPHASAQRAFMTVATACLAHADANQPHLSIDDPEVLHQFRVAYRRLRSLLSLARVGIGELKSIQQQALGRHWPFA